MTIKNIILDLGGVLLNLDKNKTISEFKILGASQITRDMSKDDLKKLINKFEIGAIPADIVRAEFKHAIEIEASDKEFDHAWNAMLQDIPLERFDVLTQLKSKYSLFLFSNTNAIHYEEVLKIYKRDQGAHNFNQFFTAQYYSHLLKSSKPNPESYREILRINQLDSKETVFIDDTLANVNGAINAGLHAIHFSSTMSFSDLPQIIENLEFAIDHLPEITHQTTDGLTK